MWRNRTWGRRGIGGQGLGSSSSRSWESCLFFLTLPVLPAVYGAGPIPPASCSQVVLLTQGLGPPLLAWEYPTWSSPLCAAGVPSPGQAASHEAPLTALLLAQRWGWDGLLPRLHPGGPGSLQAVGLQLQTPKHILWEVSLARG